MTLLIRKNGNKKWFCSLVTLLKMSENLFPVHTKKIRTENLAIIKAQIYGQDELTNTVSASCMWLLFSRLFFLHGILLHVFFTNQATWDQYNHKCWRVGMLNITYLLCLWAAIWSFCAAYKTLVFVTTLAGYQKQQTHFSVTQMRSLDRAFLVVTDLEVRKLGKQKQNRKFKGGELTKSSSNSNNNIK